MSLVTKVVGQIEPEVRKEGAKIRSRGDVTIHEHVANRIEASVFAGQTHGVILDRQPEEILYSCDCADYQENLDPCKHVWATIIEADAVGYLAGWERGSTVELMPAEDELEDAMEFDDEADNLTSIGGEVGSRFLEQIRKKNAGWKQKFAILRDAMLAMPDDQPAPWPAGKQLLYIIGVQQTLEGRGLIIELMSREKKKNGDWAKPRREPISSEESDGLPSSIDREIVGMLTGARHDDYGYYYSSARTAKFRLSNSQYVPVVQRACESGRCFMRPEEESSELPPIAWDDAARWQFVLKVDRDDKRNRFIITGELVNGEQRMDLSEPLMLLSGGLLFTRTHAARFDHNNAFGWIMLLREEKSIEVPVEAGEELLAQMLSLPQVPKAKMPPELQYEQVTVAPKPRVRIKRSKTRSYYYNDKPRLGAELSFDYDGHIVMADDPAGGIYQSAPRRFIVRDMQAEDAAAARLRSLGFREPRGYYYNDPPRLEVSANQLPAAIRVLTSENWHVEADGALYRQPGNLRIELSSNIDWFELHGTAEFGEQRVGLPDLLKALQRGERTVRLDDGTFGVLPEDWLKKYGILAGMGEAEGDKLKFGKTQVGLLDALLAAQPQITCDAVFEQARQRLRSFEGVHPAQAPPTFVGTLRPYQREGLGWLHFLHSFEFGGCLADDMGLGKTVQVLALLEERRLLRAEHAASNGNGDSLKPPPSLVVAPRSLIFNWIEEAKRFAPQLRVLDHTGIGRSKSGDVFNNYDLILTTYGTMRNDLAFLKDMRFDYVVLDEAQAIKNAASESAKASRLLLTDHRLALSGTPVQNHLGELWSLFEFLNPGMLGSAKVLQMTANGSQKIDDDTRSLLARALKPFILRRTKGQVATELPQRVEQTIHCELDATQRKLYDDLREHYRQSLMARIATEGMNKSKIQILEALLRLRQAACHPALIDKAKADQGSAKLDSLLAQLAEVTDGDHKALVFSQFTSFLALVRKRLDKEKIPYEYLDGKTRNRQTVVDHFQNDPNCRLFLVSLKAGGVGLNLTAAEYVFLLDPWWNPAVEAQAIDRAHRIGQTRQVFAYRLIAKDTVEEKVLKLQESKRELADAIINADNSVIGKLGRDDLELLLS